MVLKNLWVKFCAEIFASFCKHKALRKLVLIFSVSCLQQLLSFVHAGLTNNVPRQLVLDKWVKW